MSDKIVIDIEHISKVYEMGNQQVYALRDVTIKIHENEYLSLIHI